MFVVIMVFYVCISDLCVGGIYLIFLNMLINFGGNWCQILVLWFVDGFIWINCLGVVILGLYCSSKISVKVYVQVIILNMFYFVQFFLLNYVFN